MKKCAFIFVVITCLISACSDSNPSIDDLKNSLKETVESESNGQIELVRIEKRNGVVKEVFGQKVYTITYEATIKFRADCYMYYNKSGYGPMFESFKTYNEEPEFIPSLQMQIGFCQKGRVVNYISSASYSETEDGWILNK